MPTSSDRCPSCEHAAHVRVCPVRGCPCDIRPSTKKRGARAAALAFFAIACGRNPVDTPVSCNRENATHADTVWFTDSLGRPLTPPKIAAIAYTCAGAHP